MISISERRLIDACAAVLRQGVEVLEAIDDRLMTAGGPDGRGSAGAHFRHNLEFVENFARGLGGGRVDYHRRARERRVETERLYAAARLGAAAVAIEAMKETDLGRPLLVRAETSELWCASSVLRELDFLQSHTIHHYALIRERLAGLGFVVPPDFGVAPATLRYWHGRPEIF